MGVALCFCTAKGSVFGPRRRGGVAPAGSGVTAKRRLRRYSARPTSVVLPDPDALHVHELADAELRELAPVARALDAAEGEARVRLDEPVHEHGARLDERREALGALPARGPEGSAEPEGPVVPQAHGVLFVAPAHDGQHRAQGLLLP